MRFLEFFINKFLNIGYFFFRFLCFSIKRKICILFLKEGGTPFLHFVQSFLLPSSSDKSSSSPPPVRFFPYLSKILLTVVLIVLTLPPLREVYNRAFSSKNRKDRVAWQGFIPKSGVGKRDDSRVRVPYLSEIIGSAYSLCIY